MYIRREKFVHTLFSYFGFTVEIHQGRYGRTKDISVKDTNTLFETSCSQGDVDYVQLV